MISAIVCVDKNWGIGYQGKLLAYIPEDMRFFKEITTNSVVIMGRKTYDSLRFERLPNRINIVVTSKVIDHEINEDGVMFASMDFVKSYLQSLHPLSPINHYIIGGGQIYEELLPYCNTSYVTKVNCAYKNVDTYFPNLDKMKDWEEWVDENDEKKKYHGLEYKFCVYEKE